VIWKLREYLAKRALQKNLKRVTKGNLTVIDSAQSGCVLVNYSDVSAIDIQSIRNQFHSLYPNLSLQFVTYIKSPKQADAFEQKADWEVISKKDLAFDLEPAQLASTSYDILLDFTNKEEIPLLYLLLDKQIGIRIGSRKAWKEDMLDFMIQSDEEQDFNYLAEQMVKYLGMVKGGRTD
tara:strand:+ start:9194 stop:9730 length:537 start_codon:yes stop_codon:yes gene_type:complete